MKKIIFTSALIIFVALTITIGCKKETPTVTVPTPAHVCKKDISISYTQSHEEFNNVTFQTSSTSSDFVSYTWNFGDGSSSTSQTPVHYYPLVNSTYTVNYKAVTSCGDTVKKDTTVTISNAFTYQFKCDNYSYYLAVQGDSPINVQDASEIDGTDHYLHVIIGSSDHSLSINHHQTTSISGSGFYFGIGFWQSFFTTYGAPPVGTYSQTNCGADLVYSNLATSIFVGGDYAGMVGGQPTPGSTAQVVVSRSDTVVIGTFNFSLVGTNLDPPATCNGAFQTSRYKRYY